MFMTASSINQRVAPTLCSSVSREVLNSSAGRAETVAFKMRIEDIHNCNFDFPQNLSKGEKNLFIYKYLHKLARFAFLN